MSGTTAISSFSMIEAEFLEPKYILKHMRKLCDSADEFLQHLAPADGTINDDHRNIQEMLKPDSDFVEEYTDFDEEFKLHLKHFKGEESNYINLRAVHRALFGSYNDTGALKSGVDLALYLANTLVFAKQMIHSNRSDKDVWNRLRQLEGLFPSQFMRSLGSPTVVGDSALLKETFELGLELRTQLAILLLERSASESEFNPDDALEGVFLHSDASQENGDVIRGWTVAALGGEETSLSPEFQDVIVQRFHQLKEFVHTDTQSLENGDLVDLDGLSSSFPWEATVLQLLQWVRLRHMELNTSIKAIGDSTAILANVKKAMEAPRPITEETRPATAQRDSPRKKRSSFGRHRRRSSRKFDPNAPIDIRAIDALKARERDSGVHFDPNILQTGEEFEELAQEESAQQTVEEQVEVEAARNGAQGERELSKQLEPIDQDSWQPTLGEDDQQQGDATLVAGEEELEDTEETAPSGPPKGTQEMLAALKSVQPLGKENRKGSIFDRQLNAQKAQFGDGFDSSQPTPGPASRALNKGKQRADIPPTSSRKRAREEEEEEEESDEDDGAFEAGDRTARVQDRRQKAPVSKRLRTDPPSSAPAPPSHQPVRVSQAVPDPAEDELRIPQSRQRAPASSAPTAPQTQQEDSVSEPEAPEMTEVPPTSTYQEQRALALQNSAIGGAGRARQARRTWSTDAEEAFVEYMGIDTISRSYAKIKAHDYSDDGYGLLEDFTQVNLKDKARTMAINMIK